MLSSFMRMPLTAMSGLATVTVRCSSSPFRSILKDTTPALVYLYAAQKAALPVVTDGVADLQGREIRLPLLLQKEPLDLQPVLYAAKARDESIRWCTEQNAISPKTAKLSRVVIDQVIAPQNALVAAEDNV